MNSSVQAAFHLLLPGGELILTRRFRQPIEKVWAALSISERLAEWMGVEWLGGDAPLREGGPFHYRFRQADIETVGRVLRLEPPRLLEHSWFDNEPPGSTVRWELEPDDDGCILTLTHLFRAPEDAPRTAAGWADLLGSLARSLGEQTDESEMDHWPEQRDRYAAAFPPEATRDGRRIEENGAPALRFERMLAKPPEAVWAALTEPESLVRWLAAADVEPREGGRFHLNFHGGQSIVDGRITRWEPPHLLEHSWPEKQANGDSLVRWELSPAGAGTKLVLTHRLDAGGVVADFASGWHWHLDALDRALEGETVPYDTQRWRMLRKVYEMTLPGKVRLPSNA